MKIIIAPDSFKGTLSAKEVADTAEQAVLAAVPDAVTVKIPVADGGEGTVDALSAQKIPLTVTGPDFKPLSSFYGRLGDTAVIELAAAAGLPQTKIKNPARTTTYGVGELILRALDDGFRTFILALGGSATNDCGCGMAAALGAVFTNAAGQSFIPTGGTLSDIAEIKLSSLDARIKKSRITIMCDVTNPLCGPSGAAYVFAPQKGADKAALKQLDDGAKHFAKLLETEFGCTDLSSLAGGGAAGGCGAGVLGMLGGEMKSGIDCVLDAAGFDAKLQGASLVISGEGRFDGQSGGGKVISGIAHRTKAAGIPLAVICGAAEESPEAYEMGVSAVFSIQRKAIPLEEALPHNR